MGRIDTASLAYEQSVLSTNPASAIANVEPQLSIADWGVTLVCRPHSAGLPSAPKALARRRQSCLEFQNRADVPQTYQS